MDIEIWLAFVASSILMLIVPGPTVVTVVGFALSQGKACVLPLSIAVALGHATTLTFSIVGLGTLLSTSPILFNALKIAGGVYLVYFICRLAWGVVSERTREPEQVPTANRAGSMFRTWLVTAANPQTIVFFVAFLPQFIDTSEPPLGQLWMLSLTFVMLAAINSAIFALCAQTTAGFLKPRTRTVATSATQHA